MPSPKMWQRLAATRSFKGKNLVSMPCARNERHGVSPGSVSQASATVSHAAGMVSDAMAKLTNVTATLANAFLPLTAAFVPFSNTFVLFPIPFVPIPVEFVPVAAALENGPGPTSRILRALWTRERAL